MAIEIVDLPIKRGGSFHSYVSLPEGKPLNMGGWDSYPNHGEFPISNPNFLPRESPILQ